MFKDCKIIFINEEGIEDRDVCRDLNNRTIEIFKEIESSLVYRGIRSNQYKSFFSKDLFIVGEKAWIFDNSPKVEKMILTGRYEKNGSIISCVESSNSIQLFLSFRAQKKQFLLN